MLERVATKQLLLPNEVFVEVTKGANGVGMTLGWAKDIDSVIVKQIDPNGSAARCEDLHAGSSIVRAINGTRLEDVSFRDVIKMLRSVPRTVLLAVENVSNDLRVRSKASKRVKKIEDFPVTVNHEVGKKRTAPPPPPRKSMVKVAGPPVPSRSLKAPPSIPVRNSIVTDEKPTEIETVKPTPPSTPIRVLPQPPCRPVKLPDNSTTLGSEKYQKMKKSKIPEGAIFNAWTRDGCPSCLPQGFWSAEWQREANKSLTKSLPSKTDNGSTVDETKPVKSNLLVATSSKSTVSQHLSPLEELKRFNVQNLKPIQPAAAVDIITSVSSTERLLVKKDVATSEQKESNMDQVDAKHIVQIIPARKPLTTLDELRTFDKSKLRIAQSGISDSLTNELSGTQENSARPTPNNTSSEKVLPAKKPLTTLDELRMFDKSKLRIAESNTSESSTKGLTGIQAAFAQALQTIRVAVGSDSENDDDDEWDDSDDWEM